MNSTFISILEQKHITSLESDDNYSFDPQLMKKEMEEMHEVNKYLRFEMTGKNQMIEEMKDKVESLKYLNQQLCRETSDKNFN